MSEWLTFGQLLDNMQVGDIAESEEKEGATFGRYYVQRYDNGFYVWDGKEVDEKNHFHFMKLEACYFHFKWRILPRYVTFDRAMKALAEGKTVWAWVDGEKRLCYWIDQESGKLWGMSAEGGMTTVHNIGFFKDWTIEEDK
ncbi:hypothetical protein [Geobacillus stearothermophilus]|uniref:hypothetical protein n=1 Tax=Geobacillus stearothermophilus TaxID=1422 RepID=UPI0024028A04|nr:hypothetical protein [Geobacillus stearothermophilus]MDF9296077.1 hypothetical protein [Geobacillus stearothermophilus]